MEQIRWDFWNANKRPQYMIPWLSPRSQRLVMEDYQGRNVILLHGDGRDDSGDEDGRS